MAKYRILSCDGGGIRGVLTARLLERIVAERPNLVPNTKLFAGTSAGSFVAVGLAMGKTPTQVVQLFQQEGKVIFDRSLWHDIGDLWGVASAHYSTQARLKGLATIFGSTLTLDDLLPNKVLIATFELDSHNPIAPAPDPRSWKAKFFHNYPGPDSDGAQKVIDVVMRSSAAPVYFPIFQGFVDGGVVANNPSMCALAQAINADTGKQQLNEIALLSIGTGAKPSFITSQNGDWGLAHWGISLLDLIFDSGSGLADYECQQLIGDRYIRCQPDLPESIGLDAVDKIDVLLQVADRFALDPVLAWIDNNW